MSGFHGHMLCAVDIETTGLDPKKHDIVQVSILPMNEEFYINKQILPFNMHLKPVRIENISEEALAVNKLTLAKLTMIGIDPFQAADLLDEWFDRLSLPIGKKILPVGHNYSFDKAFLMEWLGQLSYDRMFHYHYRDTMIVANFINDRAVARYTLQPFNNVKLTTVASSLQIDSSKAHDSLADCQMVAEVYRRLIRG